MQHAFMYLRSAMSALKQLHYPLIIFLLMLTPELIIYWICSQQSTLSGSDNRGERPERPTLCPFKQ